MCKFHSKIFFLEFIFSSISCFLKIFFFSKSFSLKIWFSSKSDASWNFEFKIWRVEKVVSKSAFQIVFSDSRWFLSRYYQHQRTIQNLVFSDFLNSFCKQWTTGLRCFCLLEGAEKILFVLFPQEPLFCNARQPVHSLVSVIKINCSLHVIKPCPLFAINFPLNRNLKSVYRKAKCW